MKPRKFNKSYIKSYIGWWFLSGIILLYLVIGLIKPYIIINSLKFFLSILKKVIPVFVLIFFLMVLINYFIKPKKLVKYLGEKSGIKGYIISIMAGLISTGSIYLWYPLLNNMQEKGVRNRFIATFLYNRAVKLPLLPLLIFYFGLIYTIVLTFVMIIASIFQGILIEKILGGQR